MAKLSEQLRVGRRRRAAEGELGDQAGPGIANQLPPERLSLPVELEFGQRV